MMAEIKTKRQPLGILSRMALVEIEGGLLGEILRASQRSLPTANRFLKPEHFSDGRHRLIFQTIQKLGPSPGLVLVRQVSEAHPSLRQYINADLFCNESLFHADEVATFAQEIRRQDLLGRGRKILGERIGAAGSAKEVESAFESWKAESLSLISVDGCQNFMELLAMTMDEIEEARTKGVEMPTPWASVNRYIGGLFRGDLMTIAARTSLGKTTFGLNVTSGLLALKKRILFYCLEQPPPQLMKRLISLRMRIEGWRLRTGEISDSDWKKIADMAKEEWDDLLFIPRVSNPSIEEVGDALDCYRPDVFILDYIQRVDAPGEPRSRALGLYASRLKDFSLEKNIHTLLISQLNRQPELRGRDAIPQISDLKESGDIEEASDVVGLLYWPHYYNAKKDENEYRIYWAKNRHGATGQCELCYEPKFFAFHEQSDPEVQGGLNL